MTGHLWQAIPWALLLSALNSAITEYKGLCVKSRAVITALTFLMIYLRHHQWTVQLNYSSYLEGLCKTQVFIVFREELARLKIVSYICRDLLCHLCPANVWKTEMQLCCMCQVLNDSRKAQSSIVCSPAEELNPLKFVKASLIVPWWSGLNILTIIWISVYIACTFYGIIQ